MDLELTLTAIIVAAGLVPFLAMKGRRPGTGSPWLPLMACLTVAILAAAAVAINRPVRLPEDQVAHRPIVVPEEGYVSADTCRSCHPHHHASWHRSYHRTMTQLASPESVHGVFADVHTNIYDRNYLLERRGDEYWATWDELPKPGAFTRDTGVKSRRIEMVTGSHRMQIYWAASGETRKMEMLPIVYLKGDETWVPRRSVFIEPPHGQLHAEEAGRWNQVCIDCHTTRGEQRIKNEREMDTTVSEFGIACEACHGPAHEHIHANRDFNRRYSLHQSGKPDSTIVNPSRLDPKSASYICGQCHVVGGFIPRSDGERYEPGDDLQEFRDLLLFSKTNMIRRITAQLGPDYLRGLMWSDGEIRVSGRELNGLMDSPCFLHEDRAMTLSCQSCHTMHPQDTSPDALEEWADDQLGPGMRGNAACTQCHESFQTEAAVAAHTHHAADSAASNCYNCHMPYTSYGLLKAIRSHKITSPSVAASVNTGRPNACNQCHLDRTLEWTAMTLKEWYEIDPPPLNQDQKSVAASVLWALTGDPSQRALMAWSFGWSSAHEASGTDWIAPYLADLLDDRYDAVRYIAHRSLKTIPGFATFNYNYVGRAEDRREASQRALAEWGSNADRTVRDGDAVLLDAAGRLRRGTFNRLLANRDNRDLFIYE